MKKLLITGVLLALTASMASAQIKLAWNECDGGASGTSARDQVFACTSNLNSEFMVSSFISPGSYPQFVGISTAISLASAEGSPLPVWWQMGTTDCRSAGYAVDSPGSFGLADCTDPWTNANVGPGFAYDTFFGGTNRARIRSDLARDTPFPLVQGTHYYSQVHVIKNVKTTGATACAGCTTPVCLVLTNVDLFQQVGAPGGDIINLTNPIASPAYATWQGGAVGGVGCPAATPTKNATWGEIKTLYR